MEGVYDQIQRLPRDWHRSKLGDIMNVIRGASPRPKGDPKYFGGDIPWIMISDVTREKGKYLSRTRDHVTEEGAKKSRHLKAGTLILSNSGTVCVPKILAVDGCIHDGFIAFPAIPAQFDILYLYYFFDYIRPHVIDAHRQGITQVNLNTNIVKNIQLPVAPPRQQKEIVAEIEKQFSRLDEAVANLKHVKANLKRYKAAVLKAAVEGFLVPTEADLARMGSRPYDTGADFLKCIMAERLEAFSKRRRKYREAISPEEGLPPLTKGWCWASWDQISVWITYGFTRPMPHVERGIPIVTARHVMNDRIRFSETEETTVSAFNKLSEKDKPSKGDLLITKDGTIGRSAIVESGDPFCINQSVAVA